MTTVDGGMGDGDGIDPIGHLHRNSLEVTDLENVRVRTNLSTREVVLVLSWVMRLTDLDSGVRIQSN